MTFITIKRESKYGAGKKNQREIFIHLFIISVHFNGFYLGFFFFFFLCKRILFAYNCKFFFFEFETALNQNIKSSRRRGEGSVLGGVAVFSRSRFSVWKELSQLQGSLRRALLHWTEGTRREAGRSECWEAAQKKKRRSLFPLLSTPLLSSPLPLLSSCSLPVGSSSREAKPPLLCGDTYVFRGQTDFRPGACTEGERTGRANSHTETVQLGNDTQRN